LWGEQETAEFIDLAAHYDEFAVHYIQEVTGENAWIVVTDSEALAPSPSRRTIHDADT